MRSETLSDVTFSPGSEDGTARYRSQLGPLIEKYGLDQLLASLSPRQASLSGLLTSGTSGLSGSISLSSASLQLSLANRLHRSPALRGSTLFKLTWKVRITPSGRPISALRASALRTSGSDCGSWPSPSASGFEAQDAEWLRQRREECKERTGNGNGFGLTLGQAVLVWTNWPTPTVHDADRGGQAKRAAAETRHGSNLQDFALLASWATPKVATGDYQYGKNGEKCLNLMGQVKLVSGPPATGSPAQTEKRGQLSPDHSRWLMGYSAEHLSCAPTETRSSRKSPPNS
jgi:hypothetical protein